VPIAVSLNDLLSGLGQGGGDSLKVLVGGGGGSKTGTLINTRGGG